jgi:hypothetical protein
MLLLLTKTIATRSVRDEAAGKASAGDAPGPARDKRAATDARTMAADAPLLLLLS